jgi:myo-inositol catabolism protein IolC
MFGWAGNLNPEQTARIAAAKRVFYDGFAAAVADGAARNGAPRDRAGILVDERFDADILRDAKRDGRITCATVEKSGQGQFDFESGEEFARVQRLGEYLRGSQSHYMFELLVPATPAQLQTVGADTKGYDRQLRPALMVGAIRELQDAGVEPDVWKVEGLDRREDYERVAEAARRDGRNDVGCIVLGRGENEEHVRAWFSMAAEVPGFTGFAVGRTTFWDALVDLHDEKIGRDVAVARTARRFEGWIAVFERPQ